MLAVSKAAKQYLHSYLNSPEKPEVDGKCFRIVPTSHDLFLTLRLSKPKPDDKTYRYDGRTVLALPKSLQRVCAERRLNIDDDGKLHLS